MTRRHPHYCCGGYKPQLLWQTSPVHHSPLHAHTRLQTTANEHWAQETDWPDLVRWTAKHETCLALCGAERNETLRNAPPHGTTGTVRVTRPLHVLDEVQGTHYQHVHKALPTAHQLQETPAGGYDLMKVSSAVVVVVVVVVVVIRRKYGGGGCPFSVCEPVTLWGQNVGEG